MADISQPAPAPARLWSLDVLRALCAGIVFLSHWHLWCDFAPRGILEQSLHQAGQFLHDAVTLLTWPTGGHHPAVILFFVLSGFCIHYPYERRARAGLPMPKWRTYFLRRFQRIMPVYWAACALGLIFVGLQSFRPAASPLLSLHAIGSLEDFLVRFFAVAGLYPREIFAGNYILTTVTVEIFMYAAYPIIYWFAARDRWADLGLGFLLLHALAIALLRFFTPYWVFNSVFMLGIFWYAGALAAHLFLIGRSRVSGKWVFLVWIVFLGLKVPPHIPGLNLLKQAAWGLVCMLGILWALRIEQQRPALGQHVVILSFGRLARVSYSLYAVHTPAIMLVTWALVHLGSRSYFLQLCATMLASIVATLGVHFGIERVFYRPRVEATSKGDAGKGHASAASTRIADSLRVPNSDQKPTLP